MRKSLISFSASIFLFTLHTAAQDYDVVVYGGTPAGITAAIAAAREGQSVVLLEQTKHVGGMSASGLNRDESEHMDRRTFGGLCERFIQPASTRSGVTHVPGKPYIWQSHIAEEVFQEMLAEYKVPVRFEQLIARVEKNGPCIETLYLQNGTACSAWVFIDATYEGDLMAAAGVSYTVGREARDTYGEPLAGVRYLDEAVDVSPYDDQGRLLPGIMPGAPPAEFSASPIPLCYNIRLNLTSNPTNRVPIEKPASYDPKQHELLARCIQAGNLTQIRQILGMYPIPGSLKRECNNKQFSYVSLSIPGAQTAWSEAGAEERNAIYRQYKEYTHGVLWFLKTDNRVPETMRQEMAQYGFCKDEWQDNDHWPWYLYIRAARRMKGAYIMMQADVTENLTKSDVIHIGSHYIDSHHVARYAVDDRHYINEGRIWQKGVPFDIPYRAIIPKAEECSNLLVPVCVSASNVAFCPIRLEPTWMHLGEAAGIAAALAVEEKQTVQNIAVAELQQKIIAAGIPLKLPE